MVAVGSLSRRYYFLMKKGEHQAHCTPDVPFQHAGYYIYQAADLLTGMPYASAAPLPYVPRTPWHAFGAQGLPRGQNGQVFRETTRPASAEGRMGRLSLGFDYQQPVHLL